MKKIVYILVGVAAICLLLLTATRKERAHVKIVEFEYSRTMEFKRAQGQDAMMRLREKSLRSLRSLLEDWKYGSTSGEVPLYKKVKREFMSLSGIRGMIPDERVDEFLRATRFEIVDTRATEMPIKGRIIVNTGKYDVAADLAKSYVECLYGCIEEENASWAMKATMDKGLVVQELESKQAIRQKELSSPQLTEVERQKVKKLIANNGVIIDKAKAELEKARSAYRETWDSMIEFNGQGRALRMP